MIHKQLQPGRAVMKFAVPFADFPAEFQEKLDGNFYELGLKRIQGLPNFTYQKPPEATKHIHFAIITESRKSRSTGDSFPAFMAPLFEKLGFNVIPIEHPKPFLRSLDHQDTRQTPFAVYKDLNERLYHYRQMPFAYDLTYVQKMKDILITHQLELAKYGVGRGYNWHYQVGRIFYDNLFIDEPDMQSNLYSHLNSVHILEETRIRRKANIASYFCRPHFMFEMPQVQVVGARMVMITPEVYDLLHVPEEVLASIQSEVPTQTLQQIRQFFSSPLSFHDLSSSFIAALIRSTIRFHDIRAFGDVDSTDAFYKSFIKTIKHFYLVSQNNGYNESILPNNNNGKRQPTNIIYHFNRSFGNLFESSTFRPIHVLQSSN